ncbi:hypothetical protein G6F57_011859 [Rhizopus arrhizus]|nr:hypothetical protein G6F57_011859 [Rhizopus arrhizus]
MSVTFTATLRHLSSLAVPALPGATITSVTREDWASFHARACSRPPEPMTSTFITRFQIAWEGKIGIPGGARGSLAAFASQRFGEGIGPGLAVQGEAVLLADWFAATGGAGLLDQQRPGARAAVTVVETQCEIDAEAAAAAVFRRFRIGIGVDVVALVLGVIVDMAAHAATGDQAVRAGQDQRLREQREALAEPAVLDTEAIEVATGADDAGGAGLAAAAETLAGQFAAHFEALAFGAQHEELDGARVDVCAIDQRTAHGQQLLPAVTAHYRLFRADLPVHRMGVAIVGPAAAPFTGELGVAAVTLDQESLQSCGAADMLCR